MDATQFDRELDCLDADGAMARPVWSVRPAGLEAALGALPSGAASFVRDSGFTAAAGQITLVPGEGGVQAALLGLGGERSPWPHGGLPMRLPEGSSWRLEPGDFDMEQAVLGFCLGAYQYARLTTPKRRPAKLAGAGAAHAALATARATWLARDLVNTPANLLGPADLAAATLALGRSFGAAGRLVEGAALEAEYPTIAAVGAGAARPPAMASFTWAGSRAGADAPHVALCGKGVCFDSGGYDLKPSAAMLRMKKDMGGAALMLGLARAVMALDLPVRLSVRIGCVENMVSGTAMRPLDVLRTRRGLTVEIGNTDAEGRLVLCDLLAEASDEAPALLVDAATLTGAARVALGPDVPALFCTEDATSAALLGHGEATHDPLWRLPLFAAYDAWLASPVADLNNVTGKPFAGAIVAALFLQRFLKPGTNWVHLDTYSWNDQTRPGRPEGGEALGMRALLAHIATLPEV